MPQSKQKKDLADQAAVNVYTAALAYLSHRDYARLELERKLRQRGAEEEAISLALELLAQRGYLDDQRFAEGRVRQRRDFSRRGRFAVRRELCELGVDAELAADALEEEFPEQQERELVEQLLQRAAQEISAIEDIERRRRAVQSWQRKLLSRGFPSGVVYELSHDILGVFLDGDE